MCSSFDAGGGGLDRRRGLLPPVADSGLPAENSPRGPRETMTRSSVEVQRFVRNSGQPKGDESSSTGSERWRRAQVRISPYLQAAAFAWAGGTTTPELPRIGIHIGVLAVCGL